MGGEKMNDSAKIASPQREPDVRRAMNNLAEVSDRLLIRARDLLDKQKYVMRPEPPEEDRKIPESECDLSGELYAQIDVLRDTLDVIDMMIECTEF